MNLSWSKICDCSAVSWGKFGGQKLFVWHLQFHVVSTDTLIKPFPLNFLFPFSSPPFPLIFPFPSPPPSTPSFRLLSPFYHKCWKVDRLQSTPAAVILRASSVRSLPRDVFIHTRVCEPHTTNIVSYNSSSL